MSLSFDSIRRARVTSVLFAKIVGGGAADAASGPPRVISGTNGQTGVNSENN